ncbi:restriction endonuclease [Streptomyces sp. NPDC006976]|uniref:restriction endonuclease n=1 Tax=Streptomyces sp. NPDC006976 TaxID=3154311 RepID=UPI0033C33E28
MTELAARGSSEASWREFELLVAEVVRRSDPFATVEHDQRLRGRSGKLRQIDVLARGKVAGEEILIVVECKDHGRPVGVAEVEAFLGKLLDVAADKGVLFSSSGYTDGAVRRMESTTHPRINAYGYFRPAARERPYEEILDGEFWEPTA